MKANITQTFQAHDKPITVLSTTHDSQHIITGSADGTLKVWDLNSGDFLRQIPHDQSPPTSLVTFPHSQFLVTGNQKGIITIWNSETGEMMRQLHPHDFQITALITMADGQQFVSGAADGTVNVWHSVSGSLLYTRSHPHKISAMVATHTSKDVIIATNDEDSSTLTRYPLMGSDALQQFSHVPTGINGLAITQDGAQFIAGSNEGDIAIWDARTGDHLQTIETHQGSAITTLMPNRRYAIIGTQKPALTLWNLTNGQCIHTLVEPSDWVTALTISQNGQYILAGCRNGMLNIYELSHS